MAKINFPTSRDIYLEVNGKKLAVVESYHARTSQESRYVEAFGEEEPVGTVGGRKKHTIELSRVVMTGGGAEQIDLYSLAAFNLVIVRPDKRIVYSGCEWLELEESAALNDTVVERASIVAAKRMELENQEE